MTEFNKLTDNELENVLGGTNWQCLGACLLSHGASAIPALSEVTAAIKSKNWSKVSQLCNQPAISSLPIVNECLSSC